MNAVGTAISQSEHLRREYRADEAVVFWKTDGPFGGLSNMARGFPVQVGNHEIASVEALYQALRFPDSPPVQLEVLRAPNAWLAKRVALEHATQSRPDWQGVRVAVMRWCLKLKLGHAPRRFGALLEETGSAPIVERSTRDTFWGAVARPDGRLVGGNVLGRLLMELRENLRRDGVNAFECVAVPDGSRFILLGEQVSSTTCRPLEPAPAAQSALPFATSPSPTLPARSRST